MLNKSLLKNSLDVKNIVNVGKKFVLFDHRSAAKGKKFPQSFAEGSLVIDEGGIISDPSTC